MHLHDRISRVLKNTGRYDASITSKKVERADLPQSVKAIAEEVMIYPNESRENIKLSIASATANYHNSATLLSVTGSDGHSVSLGIRDMLIIGAMSNTHVLIRGSSGCGKTLIANGIMSAFFGRNYMEQHITPGTSPDDFVSLDFGVMQRGGTLDDAVLASKIISAPGVILNEVNRTPEILQNVLIPFLDRKFSYKTKFFRTGVRLRDEQFQYVIGTMNEGPEYGGTCVLDRAVRERFGLEISIDQFPSFHIEGHNKNRCATSLASCEAELFSLSENLTSLPLTPEATALAVYLTGLDNCVKSNSETKRGILFSPALCEGCHHSQPHNNICGSIFAPSKRVIDTLVKTARAMVKWIGMENYVRAQDLLGMGPFVFEGKGVLSARWVHTNWQGNTYKALQSALSEVYKRFSAVYNTSDGRDYLLGNQLGAQQVGKLRARAEQSDPWLLRPNHP